jgi:hypothetical protein
MVCILHLESMQIMLLERAVLPYQNISPDVTHEEKVPALTT